MNIEEENKENAYLTCVCAEQCYLNQQRVKLYRIARQTNNHEDCGKVTMGITLIRCFNRECLMHKNYRQAMKNRKEKEK